MFSTSVIFQLITLNFLMLSTISAPVTRSATRKAAEEAAEKATETERNIMARMTKYARAAHPTYANRILNGKAYTIDNVDEFHCDYTINANELIIIGCKKFTGSGMSIHVNLTELSFAKHGTSSSKTFW